MSKANEAIEVGDTVRLRWPDSMKKSVGDITYTVKGIPIQINNGATWWTLLGDQSGGLFITTELIVLEVLS